MERRAGTLGKCRGLQLSRNFEPYYLLRLTFSDHQALCRMAVKKYCDHTAIYIAKVSMLYNIPRLRVIL